MRKLIGLIGVVLCILAAPAAADIKVRAFTAGGTAIPALDQNGISSGAAVSVTLTSTTAQIFIFDGDSTTPNESIGAVTISGTTGASTLFVVVGNPATGTIPGSPDDFINPALPNATYAVNFGGLTVSTTTERLMTVFCAQISGNVTGSITVGKLRRLVAGGSVSASLIGLDDLVNGSPGSDNDYSIGRIQAQSITSAGQVRAATTAAGVNTGIYRVQLSGSLQGSVTAEDGRIGIIDVGTDISISGGSISARDDIDSIEANSITVSALSVTSGGSTFGIGRLETRTGGFTGDISAPRLRNDVTDPGIHIAGTLSGDILIGTTGSFSNVLSPISVASMSTTMLIRVSGDVRADITATSGTLGRLLIDGSLGTTTFPVTVTAAGAIGEIQALSVRGTVTSTSGGIGPVSVSPTGWTGGLDVATVSSFSVALWSGGTCKIRNLVPSSRDLNFGGVSSTGVVNLAGGLAGRMLVTGSLAGSLTLPANGLVGQVIVNAANSSGDWTGSATVGSVTLSPSRYYNDLSGVLGGGAIGLAAFHLHESDCTPPHNLTPGELDGPIQTAFTISGATPVIIRHYGPIQLDSTITDPNDAVKIDMQNPADDCDWIDMSSLFQVVLHPDDDIRAIGIQGAGTYIPKDAVYRARLVPNMLRCAQVTSNPPVVWPTICIGEDDEADSYVFRIEPDCQPNDINDYYEIDHPPPGVDLDTNDNRVIDECELEDPCRCDWNMDNTFTAQDIFDFLAAWFGGNADFNLSGTTTVQDIFDFLSCWFGSQGRTCAW